MGAIGGPVREMSFAGRTVKADAESPPKFKPSMVSKERKKNGDGTSRKTGKEIPWSCTGGQWEVDNTNGDFEFMTEQTKNPDDKDITFELFDGTTFLCVGDVEGDIEYDPQNATMTFDVSGDGDLTPQ
jgi:hypothetical protein